MSFLTAWTDMIYTKFQSNQQKIAEFSFYAFYVLLIIAKSLGYNSGDLIYKICFYVGVLFLLVKLVNTKYTLREILWIAFFLVIVFLIYFKLGDLSELLLLLSVVGMKNCNFSTIMKLTVITRIAVTVTQLLLVSVGLMDAQQQLVDDGLNPIREVYALGWTKPNLAFLGGFLAVVVFLYVFYEKLNIGYFLGTMLPMVLLYKVTYCRTGIIVYFFLWVLIIVDKAIRYKKIYWLYCLAYVVGYVISFLAMHFYQGTYGYMQTINQVFNGRIDIMNTYYKTVGLSLFPRDVSIFSFNLNRIIDNLYMSLTITSGIIVGVLFVVLLTRCMYTLYHKKCYKEIIFMVIFAVYAILEEFPLNPSLNPFMLLLGVLLYKDKVIIREKTSE